MFPAPKEPITQARAKKEAAKENFGPNPLKMECIGPPCTTPFLSTKRYITAKVHSENFVAIPKKTNQNKPENSSRSSMLNGHSHSCNVSKSNGGRKRRGQSLKMRNLSWISLFVVFSTDHFQGMKKCSQLRKPKRESDEKSPLPKAKQLKAFPKHKKRLVLKMH